MHEYSTDFYGSEMRVMVLGYIRPELDYTTRGTLIHLSEEPYSNHNSEALIEDIETDKKVAISSLARSAYAKYASDDFFMKIDV